MNDNLNLTEYVTFAAAGQLFGLPIGRVQDVFKPATITRVPLAGPEIAGVLNLRGRIVTAIHLYARLGLENRNRNETPMAITHTTIDGGIFGANFFKPISAASIVRPKINVGTFVWFNFPPSSTRRGKNSLLFNATPKSLFNCDPAKISAAPVMTIRATR